jgi:Ca2+-binding RTX toxin-like protein
VNVLRYAAALTAAVATTIFASGAAAQELPPVDIKQDLPAIEAGDVTVLGPSTAVVQASVNPDGLVTNVHVEYGETTLLEQRTPAITIGAGADPVQVAQDLVGLKPSTSYYYKVVAENSTGATSSSTQTFQTAPQTKVDPATGMPTNSAKGVECTIVGTNKADKLKGTAKADVICGLGGNDRISSGKGNDTVVGGTGNDRLNGGAGKDKVLGNGGKDRVAGASGNDRLDGGAGNDAVIGNGGKDRMAGGAGKDRLISNRDKKGSDRLNGGKGRDRATADRGDRVSKTERVHRTGRGKRKRR